VLGIGICLGFLYSNYFGGGPSHKVRGGALQLYSKDGSLNVPLIKINPITHDTYIFEFKLPAPDVTLGLETGQHVLIS